MTQPPEDQGGQPLPPLQPFAMPGPPPASGSPGAGAGAPCAHPGPGYGQPAAGYGQPPGQPQPRGGYQPYPGGAPGQPPRDPALAEWWQRLLARTVDGIIVGLLVSPLPAVALLPKWHRLLLLIQEIRYVTPATQQAYTDSFNRLVGSMTGTLLLIGLAAAAVKFGYDWLQHGLWGRTLGKRLLGTRVVMADGRGRVTGAAAGIRAAVYALAGGIPSVGFFWWLIDCLWLLWDPQRQCLHDKAAKTVVVKANMVAENPVPAPRPSPW